MENIIDTTALQIDLLLSLVEKRLKGKTDVKSINEAFKDVLAESQFFESLKFDKTAIEDNNEESGNPGEKSLFPNLLSKWMVGESLVNS